VKGVLPVPRNVLAENREYRASPEHILATTPEPKPRRILAQGTEAERLAWKQRMAETRRRNLREGMTELMTRKIQSKTQSLKKREYQDRERRRVRTAPERRDERLTNPSISKAIREALEKHVETPKESMRSQQTRANKVIRQQTAVVQRRMDQVHNLYLHARDFIVSEDQLHAEVEKVFGTDDAPVTWTGNQKSVWAVGHPSSTRQMIGVEADKGASNQEKATNTMKERLQKIAGELTGGRISNLGLPNTKSRHF
jgi:hypothetical protein